jgi:hypothetical protein
VRFCFDFPDEFFVMATMDFLPKRLVSVVGGDGLSFAAAAHQQL